MTRAAADPVDRLTRRLTLLFAAAALFAAWRASAPHPPATAPQNAAALWEHHCASCHSRDELLATLRSAPASGDRAADFAALVEFLATHGRSDPATDRLVARDLLDAASR